MTNYMLMPSKVVAGRTAKTHSKSFTPRIITLGGDHTTTLPALRSAASRWGKVSVIHFDSHIGKQISSSTGFDADPFPDTWDPTVLGKLYPSIAR
jgi:agmatinase